MFKFISSFYADDGAFLFSTRAELEACVPILHAHLQRLGLLMHVGTADKASKTECMYYPPHRDDDISAEDTALVAADATGGYVSFTDSFKATCVVGGDEEVTLTPDRILHPPLWVLK